MTRRVALLAEASPLIGTGHVREAFSLASAALAEGMEVGLWLNAATPGPLMAHAPCVPVLQDNFGTTVCRTLGLQLAREQYAVALVNLRRAENAQVVALGAAGTPIVCIDELGGSLLDCDAVINNTPVVNWHRYSSSRPSCRVHAGPEYIALGAEYRAEHGRDRRHAGPLRDIAVTFGGTDCIETTSKVVEALTLWRPDVRKHIVLGGGFAGRERLLDMLSMRSDSSFVLHENLPTLAPLLSSCDAAFTCGGNTLYELACVGTPSLVLYEERHELETARAFERLGFGVCLGSGAEASAIPIRTALAAFDDPGARQAQCEIGKDLVDGAGTARILQILRNIMASRMAG